METSTSSAQYLAGVFEKYLNPSPLEIGILLLTAIASGAAAFAAFKSFQISQRANKNAVLQLFFSIISELPMKEGSMLSSNNKQLLCNYFDYVCKLLLKGELSEKDVDIMFSVMKEEQFVYYAKDYSRKHGRQYFGYYLKWVDQ